MHIAEGVLSPAILLAGAALAAGGVALGLRKLEDERLMATAALSAVFFVGSLIHVPVGLGSAHLLLGGLLGLLLGWAAFPAIAVALVLQAVLFLYGGITVLGVNTFIMAFPGVVCAYAFAPLLRMPGRRRTVGAFCCGVFSVAGSALLASLALAFTDEGFRLAAQALFLVHLPIMAAEGVVTALVVSFLAKVRPELLRNSPCGISDFFS